MFVRYDPSMLGSVPASRRQSLSTPPVDPDDSTVSLASLASAEDSGEAEFLFFGDFESAYRAPGEESTAVAAGETAGEHNQAIWEQAAKSMKAGRLTSIFMECSYDSSRSQELMYGHLSPPGVFHELKTLASLLPAKERPLAGLRVYITHIKEFLQPHPSGLGARELIQAELLELERKNNLGVEFALLSPGDRVCEYTDAAGAVWSTS